MSLSLPSSSLGGSLAASSSVHEPSDSPSSMPCPRLSNLAASMAASIGSMSPSGVAIGVGAEVLLLAKPSRRLLAGPNPAKLHMLHQLSSLLEAVRRSLVHANELCMVRWLSQTSLSLELCIGSRAEISMFLWFS